ncbi:hypothetical protein DFH06DRAFT_1358159 [Mycena polygramma]|nr:hypothetical protein DFH06DRAFT_1358159 [Mycena polygramma]
MTDLNKKTVDSGAEWFLPAAAVGSRYSVRELQEDDVPAPSTGFYRCWTVSPRFTLHCHFHRFAFSFVSGWNLYLCEQVKANRATTEGTKKRRLRGKLHIAHSQQGPAIYAVARRFKQGDSAKMPGNRCSNCVAFNSELLISDFLTTSRKKKGLAASKLTRRGAVTSVSDTCGLTRSQNLVNGSTQLLRTAKSVVDGLLQQTYAAPQEREALLQLLLEVSRYARSLENELDTYRQSQSPSDRSDRAASSVSPKSDTVEHTQEDPGFVVDIQKLPEHLKRITVDAADHRFYGKNSSLSFVKVAMEARRENAPLVVPRATRPMYWGPQPWEIYPEPFVSQNFPPPDLLAHLVDVYFTQINIFFLILHRPTFEKALASGLHLRDQQFGAIVLAVCALGGKNSPDKRVFLEGTHGELSAGWQWFRQIRRPFSGRVVKATTLYELQLCCLYTAFQHTGSDIESCWLLSGIGILHAQDIGAHRLMCGTTPTIENELLKRSCYFLSVLDSVVSACFGRPRVAVTGECDLTRPLPVDDEYWENPDPELAFKQPAGKPALAEYQIAYINLTKVFTFSWRKSGSPQDYTGTKPLEPETVAELDSRLNKWASELPEHLLWNPYQVNFFPDHKTKIANPPQEDPVFFEQSAVQILVHRPFIQGSATNASTLKSLAICTNAARSCSTVADVKSRRGFMPSHHFVKAVFDSAVVLLLNVCGGSRSGLSIDIERELEDVYKCMKLLRQTEARWQNAGRFYDIICELMNASNLPLPPTSLPDYALISSNNDHSLYSATVPSGPSAPAPGPNSGSWPVNSLSLPMAVEDLGSLPIYESLDSFELDMLQRSFAEANSNDVATGPFPLDYVGGTSVPHDPATALDSMDIDTYLSHWMPYFSTVDGMVQAMHNGPTNTVQAMQNGPPVYNNEYTGTDELQLLRRLLELGGGGNSGTPPPELLDVAEPEEEDRLVKSPKRLVVGSELPVAGVLLARPGMDMEKVWPSLRL